MMAATMPTSTAMRHVRHLAGVIGPRGSTTPQERQAADYLRQRLEAAGLETHWETFTAPVSGWRPFALAALVGLASVGLVAFAGRPGALLAAVAMAIATASVFLEMYFQRNPLRALVARGPSQNVWARVPAAGPPKHRVLLVGHLDTHRTPWVFTSPRRLAAFRIVTTLGIVGFVLGTLLFAAIGLLDLRGWSAFAWLLAPIYGVVLALTAQPDTTPFTEGANDNASGAGIVLSLAEGLAREPLARTEVWALGSGCEEVGSYGAQAFADAHRSELPGLVAISIDNVGGAGAGVCYTSVEGMVFPLRPSRELFALAERIRTERPELNAYSLPYTTLHTDATALMVRGVPSLSFVGLTPAGVLPNWHQVGDVVDRVDAGTVERTEAFVLELLRRLDAD
jgi:multisubunit Na+/H+ antiporter MnhG subunit